jgi:hypothetical protein
MLLLLSIDLIIVTKSVSRAEHRMMSSIKQELMRFELDFTERIYA